MGMVIKKLMFLGAISIIISFNFAMAANYTVGDPNGSWDQSTDLTTWASSQTFVEGDNLIFQYTLNHDVTEVSGADFASCSVSNPLQPPHTGGSAFISLTSAGTRYFICGNGGHCLGGMKLQIDTIAASAPSPPAIPSLPPPPPPVIPSLPPPPRAAVPPPPSTTPSVPSPPPRPSAPRPASSPPLKSIAPSPSPSPKHSHAPRLSPSSPPPKAAGGSPTVLPTAPPPGSSSLPQPPAPSSAPKFSLMGALTACSGFVVIVLFNI